MGTVRNLIVALTTYAAGLMAPCCSAAEPAPKEEYTLDISRQPLMPAIRAFSLQTGLHVGFFPESPSDENILVGPVLGTLTVEAALSELLESDGLTYEWINEQSIYIAKRRPETGTAEKTPEAGPVTTHRSANQERRWPGDRKHDTESVIVIGTRLSSLETGSQSVAVLNRQKIDSYGVSTMAELFEYLPQIPFMRSEGYRHTGEQYADLRGFGTGTTLILINGRRVFGTATSMDNGGFDINTIPLTAVQRIEVLLDVPSVAAGTDASGGVINIVLKNDIPQPEIELRYGTADGGAEERRASMSFGASGATVHGAVTLDVFDRSRLLGTERDLTRNQDYRRFGSLDARTTEASPGNIRSLTGENLPGIDSSLAAVPIGSNGIDLTPQEFVATAGQRNLASPNRFRDILPEVLRTSLVASGEINLSPKLIGFAELLATHKQSEFQLGLPALSSVVVPASNAYNPFGVPVVVDAALAQLPPREVVIETHLVRLVTGVRQTWSRWTAEAWAAASTERARQSQENELDAVQTMQALASSDFDSALNPFRDGPAGSPELLASLVAAPRIEKYAVDAAQIYASARGPIFSLPAGELNLMIGGEVRQEDWQNALATSPRRTVAAAFAEAQIPIVQPEMQVTGIENLSLSLGFRGDEYTDIGTHVTPQYGLTWSPLSGLTLRASYSDIHRAPTAYELYGIPFSFPATLPDPRRGSEVTSFAVILGGNRDLQLSTGRSWTAGFELIPSSQPNLRFSASYWNAAVNDRIASAPLPILLAHEESFSELVVRAEQTPQDIAAGIVGALRSVDLRARNLGWLNANGMDATLSVHLDSALGRFASMLSGTWYEQFDTAIVEDLPVEQRVAVASEYGTIPRWRAAVSLGWTRDAISLFAAANIVSSYADASVGVRTGRTIDEQVVVDVQASLRLDALLSRTSILNAVELTAGITNVLDTEQQFSALAFGTTGYDLSQAALMKQRFWYVRLAKAF